MEQSQQISFTSTKFFQQVDQKLNMSGSFLALSAASTNAFKDGLTGPCSDPPKNRGAGGTRALAHSIHVRQLPLWYQVAFTAGLTANPINPALSQAES